jgi:excisionase family DNA binding protein
MGIVVEWDEDTPHDETMSVNEAADILGVTPTRIRAMISSGILKSQKLGMVHMVDAQSVMDRFNEPAHAGRPKREAALA